MASVNGETVPEKQHVVSRDALPEYFPTHRHAPEFWEALGRAVATFGFLEEVLGKAIFSFTAMRRFPADQVQAEYEKWLPTLERALIDPLGRLLRAYGDAVRSNPSTTIANLDILLSDLTEASTIRNVLCHGSWRSPDDQGRSLPFFVDNRKLVFQTPIDIAFLQETQRNVADLTCAVVDTVTSMGWQFPGSSGPGTPIA